MKKIKNVKKYIRNRLSIKVFKARPSNLIQKALLMLKNYMIKLSYKKGYGMIEFKFNISSLWIKRTKKIKKKIIDKFIRKKLKYNIYW